MAIEGPLRLSVAEDPDRMQRELRIDFTEAFRNQDAATRASEFRHYVDSLRRDAEAAEPESAERAGMLAVLRVVEQLVPYIEADEIPLEETIVGEVRPDVPLAVTLGGNAPGAH